MVALLLFWLRLEGDVCQRLLLGAEHSEQRNHE